MAENFGICRALHYFAIRYGHGYSGIQKSVGMKKSCVLTCVIGAAGILVQAAGCGTVELERPADIPGHVQDTAGGGSTHLPERPKELYVTGVEYPEGYDWKADSDYGYVACTVFLMKDGERIVELDVDDRDMVASDADMHRCFGGHLYTDYSTESETVIKKDGDEMFRYPDRELICGFQVIDDDVYTLGMPRTGDGWTYRRNGKLMMVKTAGYLMTGLEVDNGELWFAYVDPVATSDGVRNRYYIVRDGNASPVGTGEDVECVDDILLHGGTVYYTARLAGIPGHVMYRGDSVYSVDAGSARETSDCRIHYDGGSVIYISGKKCFDIIGDMCSLWKNFRLDFNYQSGTEVQEYYVDGDEISYIMLDTGQDPERLSIFDRTSFLDLGGAEEDYIFLGPSCGYSGEGHLYVALHPRSADIFPALLVDGQLETYGFNGYFTSVSAW